MECRANHSRVSWEIKGLILVVIATDKMEKLIEGQQF
jgi:hypothetical protein